MNKKKKINKNAIKGRIAWLYVKYQILSKILVGALIFPLFSVFTQTLINSSGRTNISSGDYLGFFFSIQGIPFILLTVLLLILVLGMDINTFIIISASVEEGKLKFKIKDILIEAFKSLKHFFSPIGVFIVAFVAIVLPLLELGVSLGPLKNFKIPNFITSVIFSNNLYYTAYIVALTLLTIISLIYIFTLHFLIIDKKNIKDSLKSSRLILKKYWKKIIPEYIWKLIKVSLLLTLLAVIIISIVILVSLAISPLYSNINTSLILLTLLISEISAFFAFMSVPIAIFILTKLFYKYNKLEGKTVRLDIDGKNKKLDDNETYKKIKLKTKIEIIVFLILIILFNFTIAIISEGGFNQLFKTEVNVEIIAHRGGGDLGAENTVEGIKEAIKNGVSWTEIDVQRTKDGKYIINHDKTFARIAGEDRKPSEMTLDDIRKLKVKNEFYPEKKSQPVATFDDILNVSKGKIGVFVELKGETADEKMVDDVVKIIKSKKMLDECVILSLDYDIIKYTAQNYPEIKTGFLYFFSMGDLKDLKGDYLIMEEREATDENIDNIHDAGKKAVVWTVNTTESINKFIYSDVDGIITDHVLLIKEAINTSKDRTQLEIIIDSLIKWFKNRD